MSYKDFFQLGEIPFSNTPGERFYFDSEAHKRVLARLTYAVEEMKGLAICTGGIGAGKTMLARRMLRSLPAERYETALLVIVHSGISAEWLLKRIALQLGIRQPANSGLTLLSQLYRRLIQIYEEGRKAVVMIDEAQMLQGREIMEELRGLLNLEVPGRKLVTFVLFGLPELMDNLKLDEPLLQRVAVRCEIETMNLDSTRAYIRHRLDKSGAAAEIFNDEAVNAIQSISGGVPRLVNTLCDNALYDAAVMGRYQIDGGDINKAASDLGLLTAAVSSAQLKVDSLSTAGTEDNTAPDDLDPYIELAEFDRLLNRLDDKF